MKKLDDALIVNDTSFKWTSLNIMHATENNHCVKDKKKRHVV
jgi:hypothetical protein